MLYRIFHVDSDIQAARPSCQLGRCSLAKEICCAHHGGRVLINQLIQMPPKEVYSINVVAICHMNEVTSAAPPQVEECEVRLDVPEVCCIGAPAAVPGSARTRDVVEALVDRKAIRSTFGLEGQATAEAWREWPWVSVNDVHLQLQRTTGGARSALREARSRQLPLQRGRQ